VALMAILRSQSLPFESATDYNTALFRPSTSMAREVWVPP